VTRVDFYVLADRRPLARERIVCRLAEKAYGQQQRLYVHAQAAAQVEALDGLLWTFRQQSFIPHGRLSSGDSEPVLLGHDGEPPHDYALLINLAPEVPLFFSRFERVIEVIDGTPERRAQGRERFRFYKDRGYSLQTHKL